MFPTTPSVEFLELPSSSNKRKELDELAQSYVKYMMLAELQADAMHKLDPKEMNAAQSRVVAKEQYVIKLNPTTLEGIQSELDESSTQCKMEPKSFDE